MDHYFGLRNSHFSREIAKSDFPLASWISSIMACSSMMTRFFAFTVVMGACAVSALPSAPVHSFWSAASHAPGTWTRLGEKVGCALSRTQMRLRGGAAEVQEEEAAPKPAGFAAQLYIALKDNKSLDPNDHPSSFQWMLTGLNVRSSLRSCAASCC